MIESPPTHTPTSTPAKMRASFGQRLNNKALHVSFGLFSGITSAGGIAATTIAVNFARLTSYFPSVDALTLGGLGSIALGAGLGLHEATRKRNVNPKTGLTYDYDHKKTTINPSNRHIIRSLAYTAFYMSSIIAGDVAYNTVQRYFKNRSDVLNKQQTQRHDIVPVQKDVPAYYAVTPYKLH